MKKIIVWGATGQAKVLLPILEKEGFKPVTLIDRNRETKSFIPDCPIFYSLEELPKREGEIYFTLAIGGDRGRDRVELHGKLTALGYKPATLIHSAAFVEASASIGDGVQICAMATVAVEAKIGTQTIINTNASIDHECVLGKGCHVMPGATLAGCVVLADYCTIGSNATILPRVKIGEGAFVGAGAVVTKDVPSGITVIGTPAREMKA